MITSDMEKPIAQSIWHNRDFLFLWAGQSFSQLGSQVSQFAFPLLVLLLTGSPALAGGMSGLLLVPYVLLSLPAGALIDRLDRRWVMILCDIGRAVCVVSIPLALALGHLTLTQLCLAALGEGTCFVFFSLAEVACFPQVVPGEEQFVVANSYQTATTNVAYLAGPALGGFFFGVGRAFPFLFDVGSYVLSIATLLCIRTPFQKTRQRVGHSSLRAEIQEGVVWLSRQPLLRLMTILGCSGNAITNSLLLFFIAIGVREHVPSWLIGIAVIGIGAGGVIGSLLAGPLQRRFALRSILLSTQWIGVLLFPAFLLLHNVVLLGVVTVFIMTAGTVEGVTTFVYRIQQTPDELQGRVNSVYRLVAYAGPALGFAGTGLLLQISLPVAVLVLEGIILFFAIVTTFSASLRATVQNTRMRSV